MVIGEGIRKRSHKKEDKQKRRRLSRTRKRQESKHRPEAEQEHAWLRMMEGSQGGKGGWTGLEAAMHICV